MSLLLLLRGRLPAALLLRLSLLLLLRGRLPAALLLRLSLLLLLRWRLPAALLLAAGLLRAALLLRRWPTGLLPRQGDDLRRAGQG